MSKPEQCEQCLVVPRKALFGYNDERAFSGFRTPEQLGFDLETVLQKHSSFGWRNTSTSKDSKEEYDVENDEAFKHFSSNGIFLYENTIFTYTRIGGEPRLVGRNDILISGHVNPLDMFDLQHPVVVGSYHQAFVRTLHREFQEEVESNSGYCLETTPFGYVNDESPKMVDKVHFGVVYLIHGNSPEIHINRNERNIMIGSLKTVDEIENLERPLESWSKYVFEAVKKYLGK